MSAKLMGEVWELDIPQRHAWVLMSLCDHAEHDGTQVFPGNGYTAWKTGYSKATIKRTLRELRDDYELVEVVADGGGKRASEYRICIENFDAHRKEPLPGRGAPKGNKNASGEKQTGVKTTNRVQCEPGSGENKPGSLSRARDDRNRHIEPSSLRGGVDTPKQEEKPAKVMTTLTIDRTREVGFDAAPHQKANWGKGWSEFVYVPEGETPPSAERQYAVLNEIVAAAAGKRGKARFFRAVEDAVKLVDEKRSNVRELRPKQPNQTSNPYADMDMDKFEAGMKQRRLEKQRKRREAREAQNG